MLRAPASGVYAFPPRKPVEVVQPKTCKEYADIMASIRKECEEEGTVSTRGRGKEGGREREREREERERERERGWRLNTLTRATGTLGAWRFILFRFPGLPPFRNASV